MSGNMGYNYPLMQEHFYPIQASAPQGYISPMEMSFKEALEHAMRVTGRAKSLRDLAGKAGVSYDILKNISQNKSERPNAEAAARIADFFGASLKDFYSGRVPATGEEAALMIAVAGKVGAGAEVELVDAYAKGDGHRHVACPPQLTATGIVAVEVEGDSMVPMYQPGDILFYTRATHEGILEEDIGRACVVEDASGHAWVKQVKRGDEPGQFHLISLNPLAETRHNQRIKWAARVKLALPAEFVVRQM